MSFPTDRCRRCGARWNLDKEYALCDACVYVASQLPPGLTPYMVDNNRVK